MWLVSFASRICFARSSPNNSLDEGGTLLEQIVWNSCFNDGLSCSRLIEEISKTTCPTRAMASMLSVTISFVSIWDLTARSLSQVVTIAKVAFCKACCMFARRKSAFLLAAFKGVHISGFTRPMAMSSQFSGCRCLPRMLLILSDCSFVPHRLIAISASCCCTFGPFVSSSCREATSSVSNSSSLTTSVLSGAVARAGGSASSCATSSSSVACTLRQSSSLLDLRRDSFSCSEGSSEEMETERRLRRSWPAPGGLRLEELASIFPVGRRAHTSVRSCHRAHIRIKLPQS